MHHIFPCHRVSKSFSIMRSYFILFAVLEKSCFRLFFDFIFLVTLKFSPQTPFDLLLLLFLPFVLLFNPISGI